MDSGPKVPGADDHVIVPGFTTPRVCDLVGVAPSTLNAWARPDSLGRRLVRPSYLDSAGKRSDRIWSVRDVVVVRVIKALRQAGCPLNQVRKAQIRVEASWDGDLSSVVLYWDGHDLIATDPWGDFQSMLRHPGQLMFHALAVPLDAWRADAESWAKPVDLTEIHERRAKRAGRARTPEPSAPMKRQA